MMWQWNEQRGMNMTGDQVGNYSLSTRYLLNPSVIVSALFTKNTAMQDMCCIASLH